MKTKVELRLSEKPDIKILKEIRDLSKVNIDKTNKTIKVTRDEIDDNLVIVIFESPKGKHKDLGM